ncbi:MAG: hypothetical protein R3335_02590, partial [Anaerolineales bacterium]|nr:hypothetical protein [Anaerolineales bacterium]
MTHLLEAQENRRVRIARAFWYILVLITIVAFIAALSSRYTHTFNKLTLASGGGGGPLIIPIRAMTTYLMIGESIMALSWFTMGVITFWWKSDEWQVIFFSSMMVSSSVFFIDFSTALME